MRNATRGFHGVRSLGWAFTLFAAIACGSDATEPAARLGVQTSALVSDDGGVLDAALSTFDGSTAGNRATSGLESEPNPRAEGVEYIELGEPAFSSEGLMFTAPVEEIMDGGLPDADGQTPSHRFRRLETQDVRPLVEQPDFELEIHTCANSAAPVATDKAYLTVQAAGEARGWELTTSRAANATVRFAFLWTGASMDQLQALKLELRGTSSWCVDRLILRWYGLNRSALNNPQELWSWTSSVTQPGTYPYLHGHPSAAQAITLDNNASTARTSFIRFALDTAAYRVATHASRCNESVQRRGFCVRTCGSAAAGTLAGAVAVKHDNLWDFLSVRPGEVDQPNDTATINDDNFCAIRNLQSIRLSALFFDPWSVCGTYFHSYERIPLSLPAERLSARAVTPLAASDNCANGYASLWSSPTDARTTSTTTGSYAYTVNQNIDACTGANCVTAREGFVLTPNDRVKACLAGSNSPDSDCDGVDDDCDGLVDEHWVPANANTCLGECWPTAACRSGAVACGTPSVEVPGNGKNEDCDGKTDEIPPRGACTEDTQCDFDFLCHLGICVAPHCGNGIYDVGEGEQGNDCGGADCEPCDGQSGCAEACRVGEETTPPSQAVLRFSTGRIVRTTPASYEPQEGVIAFAAPSVLRWTDIGGDRMALLEGASGNSALRSSDLNVAPWSVPTGGTSSVTANAFAGPDLSQSAERVRLGLLDRGPAQSASVVVPSTFSVYAKDVENGEADFRAVRAFVVDATQATVSSQRWPLDQVWRRVSLPVPAVGRSGTIAFSHAEGWPTPGVRRLSTPDVGLWGVQLEALPFATSYVPTTTQSVTRDRDVLTFSSVPAWMASGTWQMDVAPEYTSSELIPNWAHTLASSPQGRVSLVQAGSGAAYVQANFTGQTRSAALRWDRDTVLTLTFNTATDVITIAGSESGAVQFSAPGMTFSQRLRIGGRLDGEEEAYAAFSEPRRVAAPTATCEQDASCSCGNSSLETWEECDTRLTASCDGECNTAPPEPCEDDLSCANGKVCKEGMAASFDLPAHWKVCVPTFCPSDNPTTCGTVASPCGKCQCTPQCEGKVCGDDPSDGCGGTCLGLCGSLEVGCQSNDDCEAGDFCWIDQAWRYQQSGASQDNVCAPVECDDIDPRRIDCGTASDPCGRCDLTVPPCLKGALCRRDDAPACPDAQRMNMVGACVPSHDVPVTDNVATAAIGALPGTFSVSPSGSAQYRIPIAVPPGRAGLAPNLSITYDSARGNSMLGVGWALEGLSQIQVCPKTVAQDGYIDGTVALCVGGSRLVPIKYDASRNVTEWRTEIESFTKYETSGDFYSWGGSAPSIKSFVARTKDGLTLTYGISEVDDGSDPARLPTGSTMRMEGNRQLAHHVWALGSVRDRAGNEMRIHYMSLDGVELLPLWIGYNFVGVMTDDAAAEVVFDYRDEAADSCSPDSTDPSCHRKRQDAIDGYTLGQRRAYTRVLGAIRVHALGQEIRRYELTPTALENGLTTIEKVTECVAGDVCRPATRFQFSDMSTPPAYELDGPLKKKRTHDFYLDFDGDGRPERAALTISGSSNGYTFIKPDPEGDASAFTSERFLFEGKDRPESVSEPFVRDMDGDGAQDLVFLDKNGRLRVLMHGDQTRVLSLRMEEDGERFEYQPTNTYYQQVVLADVNGDGRPDAVFCGNSDRDGDPLNAMVHVNLGNALSVAQESSLRGGCNKDLVINDAAGRQYIIWKRPNDAGYALFGESKPGEYTEFELPESFRKWNAVFRTADVNGDGLIDLVSTSSFADGRTQFNVAFNKGNLEFSTSRNSKWDQEVPGIRQVAFADVNADGRDDLISLRNMHLEVDGVLDQRSAADRIDSFIIADANGDGTPDIIAQLGSLDWKVYPGISGDGGLLEYVTVPLASQGMHSHYEVTYTRGQSGDTFVPASDADVLPKFVVSPRKLSHPVVEHYYGATMVQSASEEKDFIQSERFTYRLPMRDRDTGAWLGFGERTARRVNFGGVREAITTYKVTPERAAGEGPFSKRDPRLRQGDYIYRYYPFAGAGPDNELTVVVIDNTANALTSSQYTTHLSQTTRVFQELRSDADLPFSNVVLEEHRVSENDTIVDWVTFGTERDVYGNVTWSIKNFADEQYELSEYAYAHETDSGRVSKWQVDLLESVARSASAPDGSTPYSEIETYSYRPDGLLRSVRTNPDEVDAEVVTTISREDLTTASGEDTWKNPTSVIVEAGEVSGPRPAARSWSFIYDRYGVNVETSQNSEGHSTTMKTGLGDGLVRYSSDINQRIARWKFDGFGRVKEENRETEGIVTTFTYGTATRDGNHPIPVNGAWQVTSTTTSAAAAESVTETSIYNPIDQLVRHVGAGFRAGTKVSQEFLYRSGRLWKASRPHLEGDDSQSFVEKDYDEFGRVIAEWSASERKREIHYASSATVLKDFKGRRQDARWVARVVSPKLTASTYYTDAKGNLVEAVEGDTSTTYNYGARGFLREVRDTVGNVTVQTPDHLGRVVSMVDPDTGLHGLTYNNFGEVKTATQNTESHTYDYDSIGRLVEVISSDGVIRNTYDSMTDPVTSEVRSRDGALMRTVTQGVAGRTEAQSPGGGHIDDYYYDGPVGSLSKVRRSVLLSRDPSNPTREAMEVAFDYDKWMRPSVVHYPGVANFAVEYKYDANGFLVSASDKNNPAEQFYKLEEVYQGFRPKRVRLGTAMTQEHTFSDLEGWVDETKTTKGLTPIVRFGITHDANGNVRSVRRFHFPLETEAKFYHYDGLERLTSVTSGETGPQLESFSHTKTGNLHTKSGTGTYVYGATLDETDDRPQTLPHFARTVVDGGVEVARFVPDAFGRVKERVGPSIPGNLQKFDYDAFGRLKRVETGAGHALTEFEYSAGGERVLRREGTDDVLTTYFGPLYEHRHEDDVDVETFRIMVNGQAVAERTITTEGASTRYLHRNHLGSVEAVTDDVGNVVDRRNYNAFGEDITVEPAESVLSFTGHRAEKDIGMVDMLGRFYDAKFGRFLTPDPFVAMPWSGQSLNRYSYVLNSPASLVDPTGFTADVNPWTGQQQDPTACPSCGGGYVPGQSDATSGPEPWQQSEDEECHADFTECMARLEASVPKPPPPPAPVPTSFGLRGSPVDAIDGALEGSKGRQSAWERGDYEEVVFNAADSGATALAGFVDTILFNQGDRLRGWVGTEKVINTESAAYKGGSYAAIGVTVVTGAGAVVGTYRAIQVARAANAARAGIGAVGATEVAEGLVGAARASPAEILAANRAAGLAAERLVAQQLVAEGNVILGSQVSVRTSLGLRRIDHLIRTAAGDIVAIEVKAGNAIRNASQLAKDALLGTEGGMLVGKNAPDALRGTRLIIQTVERVVP